MNLRRVVDRLRDEANMAVLEGHEEAAIALNSFRAVLLEELAEQECGECEATVRRFRLVHPFGGAKS